MIRTKFFALAAFLAAAAALAFTPAAAEAAKPKKKNKKAAAANAALFAKLDADKDGKLSKEEFAKIGDQKTATKKKKTTK